MIPRFSASLLLLLVASTSLAFGPPKQMEPTMGTAPSVLDGVGVDEKLGARIDLDARVRDEHGQEVPLRSVLSPERPTVLTLAYYQCPMLCSLVLTGLAKGIREMPAKLGSDYQSLTLSIDPRDTTERAAEWRGRYLAQSGTLPNAAWRFLTGDAAQVKRIADSVGFRYAYDALTKQYAHGAVAILITPDGTVSRYLYGVDFPSKDLRFALLEAADGKTGTTVERIVLSCFKYDPGTRTYGFYVLGFLRLWWLVGLVVVAGLVLAARARRTKEPGPPRGRSDEGAKPGKPPGTTLVLVLGALIAFGPLSIDMYLPALPAIQKDLGASAATVGLTLAAFFVGLAAAQLVYGPLSDRFGRKRPVYAGLALYVLASLCCALAPSVPLLIVGRFFQAVGAAAGITISRAVVRDLYRGREAARLMSLLMLVMGIAPILAPVLGSLTLELGTWRLIFAVLATVGAACLAFTAAALPETAPAQTSSEQRASVFRRYADRLADRRFVAYVMAGAASQSGMFAYITASPFVLMKTFGFSPRTFSIAFGCNAFGLIAGSQLNRRLLKNREPWQVLRYSTAVACLAAAALGVAAFLPSVGLPFVLAGLFVFVGSLGFIGPNTTALALEDQGQHAGLASALLGSLQFGTSAVVSALVGAAGGDLTAMAAAMCLCALAALVLARRAEK